MNRKQGRSQEHENVSEHRIPFGRHRDESPSAVPSPYLKWLITIKLSTGLRTAIVEELRSRGIATPDPPPPPPVGPCSRCGDVGQRASWQTDRNGQSRIRLECQRCRALLQWAPQVEPWLTLANRSDSETDSTPQEARHV